MPLGRTVSYLISKLFRITYTILRTTYVSHVSKKYGDSTQPSRSILVRNTLIMKMTKDKGIRKIEINLNQKENSSVKVLDNPKVQI